MDSELKSKIYELVDSLKDENVLQMVIKDVTYYADRINIIDELNEVQTKELNEAISEADNSETIDWKDFKKEINEWKKR